jgi:hypothetical protein
MKIPTKTRLGDWYKKLMKMALDERIGESFETVKNYAEQQNWDDVNNIPCFENDLWTARLEDAITLAEKRTTKKTYKNLNVMEMVLSLLKIQIEGFDQHYFILNLRASPKSISHSFPEIITCKWVSSRNNLINTFSDHNLEFCNERLAKFSTSVLMYRTIIDLGICVHCYKFTESGLTVSNFVETNSIYILVLLQ